MDEWGHVKLLKIEQILAYGNNPGLFKDLQSVGTFLSIGGCMLVGDWVPI